MNLFCASASSLLFEKRSLLFFFFAERSEAASKLRFSSCFASFSAERRSEGAKRNFVFFAHSLSFAKRRRRTASLSCANRFFSKNEVYARNEVSSSLLRSSALRRRKRSNSKNEVFRRSRKAEKKRSSERKKQRSEEANLKKISRAAKKITTTIFDCCLRLLSTITTNLRFQAKAKRKSEIQTGFLFLAFFPLAPGLWLLAFGLNL
jgi:hypothetical protein